MTTYPNQKIIHITKQKVVKDFLQISNENLFNAMKELTGNDLKLYLYLASNANNFNLALSQSAVEDSIGIPKTSFHRSVKSLIDKGYIVEKQGNILNFFEVPVPKWNSKEEKKNESSKMELSSSKMEQRSSKMELSSSKMDREIDKHINTYKDIYAGNSLPQAGENPRQTAEGEQEQEEKARVKVKALLKEIAKQIPETVLVEDLEIALKTLSWEEIYSRLSQTNIDSLKTNGIKSLNRWEIV